MYTTEHALQDKITGVLYAEECSYELLPAANLVIGPTSPQMLSPIQRQMCQVVTKSEGKLAQFDWIKPAKYIYTGCV